MQAGQRCFCFKVLPLAV